MCVWNLENGGPITVFTCDRPVLCIAKGGDLILAGDEGGHVHLFRWEE